MYYRSLKRVSAFVVGLTLFSCNVPVQRSQLASNEASPLYAKLVEENGSYNVFVSVPVAVRDVAVCLLANNASDSCAQNHSGYRKLIFSKSHSDRAIFKYPDSINPSSTHTYHVMDHQAGVLLGKIRIVEAGTEQQHLNQDTQSGQTGVAVLNLETLRSELTHLASDEFNGRLAGTADQEKAQDYIIDHLKKLDIKPVAGGEFRQRFRVAKGPMQGQTTANIIAMLPGQDPALMNEYIVIGAHLDHAGTLSRGYTCSSGGGSDSICNGADDNASGSIGVLNVAKALASVRKTLKRSVIFMWFSAEEEGLLGSYYYVANPLVPLRQTVYMINMDMIGYMKSNGNKLAALGGGTSEAGASILRSLATKYPERKISITERAGGGSDHVPFMSKGIPGVFLHTGVSNNKNYHKTSDHVDKIDFEGMLYAVRTAYELVVGVANTSSLRSGLLLTEDREPLVTEEEMQQTCHHLMKNPFVAEALDFTYSNSGIAGDF